MCIWYKRRGGTAHEEHPEGAGDGSDGLLCLFFFHRRTNMEDIVKIISSVGFPIAMCLLLFWYMKSQLESHKEETSSLKDAINKLELAITTLVTKLTDK